MSLKHLKPGDQVFVVHQRSRYQKETHTETLPVVRMGRKYGYVEKYGRESPFCLQTGYSVHNESNVRVNGYGFDVYLSEADWQEEKRRDREKQRLKDRLVNNYGRLNSSIDWVLVDKLLDEEMGNGST